MCDEDSSLLGCYAIWVVTDVLNDRRAFICRLM